MIERGMNDGDDEWEMQTGLRHMHILWRRGGWARAWVEGCRNSAACIAFNLIPAIRSFRGFSLHHLEPRSAPRGKDFVFS